VLKTKGLRKALKFLDELYKNVLRKADLTLKEQPTSVIIFKLNNNLNILHLF